MDNFNTNTDNREEWLPPPEIIKALGEFDLDPCYLPPDQRPWDTAKTMYWKDLNGLAQDWSGRVWLNPPYGKKTFDWMKKLADHGNGIALIFARTETIGFQREIFGKADAIFFFKGRINFYFVTGEKTGACNAPSCLVAFGQSNLDAIKSAKLSGYLVYLKDREGDYGR